MSYIDEWQLIAHSPQITAATASVAQAIARRIKPGKTSERIPHRTLLAESLGVSSKATISKALTELKELGVIQLQPAPKGSRKATLIIWALECPENCEIDHANGNTKTAQKQEPKALEIQEEEKATRPNPQDTTRPNPQDALISINKRERSSLISSIEKALNQIEEKTDQHQALIKALANSEELALVQVRAEQIALKPHIDNPANYLGEITRESPWKLLPKPKPKQAPPDFSHLPKELREVQERKYKAQIEVAVNEH